MEAYAGIGEALYSLNRSSEESLTALQKAESLDPQNETPHALLGRLYQDAGQQNKAIEELETAHRLAPSDREVTYRLYRIYGIKGDTANADRLQTDLETLLASNHAEADSETKAMVLNNTGIELEKKGDMAGALEHYEEAAKTDVSNLVFSGTRPSFSARQAVRKRRSDAWRIFFPLIRMMRKPCRSWLWRMRSRRGM